ncbi:hypothetical protein [Curtobacterium sp. MCBD17_040]|uniref:DUF4429 domain-containing protein n=1 Tax=Curtobacterium sp. MCBD17_040 TaxID=2175674 RepID=UPI000DA8F016|nr:hypothetical protein [Curtobacterium sp. MCBD17_040]WIB65911.1 hypothetical protein DEI94_17500 [Curtobacterium sp. MCBD17_040]
MSELSGYGMKAAFDGTALVVTATSAVARGALGTKERIIPVAEISAVRFRPATLLKNGAVTVQTSAGITAVRFLGKAQQSGRALYEELLAASGVDPAVEPSGPLANEAAVTLRGKVEALERAKERTAERAEAQRRQFSSEREEMTAEWNAAAADRRAGRDDAKAQKTAEAAASAAVVAAFADGTLTEFRKTAEVPPEVLVYSRLHDLLDAAAAHAAKGEIVDEERLLRSAAEVARVDGGRAARKALTARIQRMTAERRLRVDSKFLGVVSAENGFSQVGRKGGLLKVAFGEKKVTVYSDRILTASEVQLIDQYTSAQVYLDGQELVTTRPTLTRMALLAPLPGSALIPGLALQKKEKADSRQGEFQVGGRGWSYRVMVHPDQLSNPRAIAEQINRHANEAADRAAERRRPPAVKPATPVPPAADVLTQLERLQALVASGALTQEEADTLKRGILG